MNIKQIRSQWSLPDMRYTNFDTEHKLVQFNEY